MVWQDWSCLQELCPWTAVAISSLFQEDSTTRTEKLVVSGFSSCSFSWRSHPEQRVAFGSYREQLHGCVQYATCRQAVVRVDNGQQQQWLGVPGAEHYHLWQWQVAVWAAEMA